MTRPSTQPSGSIDPASGGSVAALMQLLGDDSGPEASAHSREATLKQVFHLACFLDDESAVDELLSSGVGDQLRQAPHELRSLLMVATLHDAPALIDNLTQLGADINATDRWGCIPLHHACEHDAPNAVRAFIAAGADINARSFTGQTPLHCCALGGEPGAESAQALCKAGAAVNTVDGHGRAPIHAAASRGHTAVVETLLAAGARFKAKALDGNDPLQLACLTPRGYGVARALIDAGARVDKRGRKGLTPLHCLASVQATADFVRLLIDAGADPSAVDADGATALEHARFFGAEAVVSELTRDG